MRSLTVAVALSLAALTACSGATEDGDAGTLSSAQVDEATAAWQADVEEALGTDTFDFAALERDAATDCQRTTADAWTIGLSLDGATSATTTAITRIGLEHACSDVVAAFDKGLEAVEGADDTTALACSLPRSAAIAEDRAVLDMTCPA
jgi:hypothetical protein